MYGKLNIVQSFFTSRTILRNSIDVTRRRGIEIAKPNDFSLLTLIYQLTYIAFYTAISKLRNRIRQRHYYLQG